MPESHYLSVTILDSDGNASITLDATDADATLGGFGHDGRILGISAGGDTNIEFDAGNAKLALGRRSSPPYPGCLEIAGTGGERAFHVAGASSQVEVSGPDAQGTLKVYGDIRVCDGQGREVMVFDASNGVLRVGANGNEGDLQVFDSAGRRVFDFNAASAWLEVGADGNEGDVVVRDGEGNRVFHLNGSNAAAYIGSAENEGDVVIRDSAGRDAIHADGGAAHIRVGTEGNEGDLTVEDAFGRRVFHANGSNAAVYLGAEGNEGDLIIRDGSGRDVIHADGNNAWLRVGTQGNEGDIAVHDASNRRVFHMDGNNAWLQVGTAGNEGDLAVHDASDRRVFHMNAATAALYVGAAGNEGDVIVRDDAGNETIHLNGQSGDIILRNADAAEDFSVHPDHENAARPGTVMVLHEDGRIEPSSKPYDTRVVGVVAGAGDYRPGLVMDRQEVSDEPRVPISVMGKVSVRADASYGEIRAGDLLTTSATPGAAMKVSDTTQAFGAVIGKALTPLREGEGWVNLLISMR